MIMIIFYAHNVTYAQSPKWGQGMIGEREAGGGSQTLNAKAKAKVKAKASGSSGHVKSKS